MMFIEPRKSKKSFTAASHGILERGRCSCNALEYGSPLHTPHAAARLSVIRFSRAALRTVTSSRATASPIPKNIASGVSPPNAECGITWLWATT